MDISRQNTIATAMVVLGILVTLNACSGQSETDKHRDRIVASCVADGEDKKACACQADALKESLDEETFVALADFVEGMAQAESEAAKGMLARGALANPKLAAALDKAEQAKKACKQTAAQKAAKVEEEQQQIPPLGPLRKDCPPTLASAARPDGKPVDDIVGLRPGLSFDDAQALLECRDDIRVIQTAALWSAQENYGIPTRQLLRASDGIPCTGQQAARADACDTGGGRFEPLRNITREYIVVFTGMPGQEISRAIWRRTLYAAEDKQAISVLSQALADKYGQPQLQASGDHSRINHVRAGATNLVWLSSREGAPIPPPASQISNAAMSWETCVNGLKPQFVARQGWNSGCNLTIRAEILPQQDNGLLARELNMVVVNQRDLYHGDKQFQQALRIVSEEKLRKESAAPDL